jgi:hypothetical protein
MIMRRSDPKIIEKCRKNMDELLARPVGEMFARMIARGAIDEQGRVLLGGKGSTNGRKLSVKKSNGAIGKKKKSSNGKHS